MNILYKISVYFILCICFYSCKESVRCSNVDIDFRINNTESNLYYFGRPEVGGSSQNYVVIPSGDVLTLATSNGCGELLWEYDGIVKKGNEVSFKIEKKDALQAVTLSFNNGLERLTKYFLALESGLGTNDEIQKDELINTDSDNDGIPDDKDDCPSEAGTPENSGCPSQIFLDTDGDGVLNKDDKCINEAGPKELNGCPVIYDGDRDGDGILDKNDVCPDLPGKSEDSGCPPYKPTINPTPSPTPIPSPAQEIEEPTKDEVFFEMDCKISEEDGYIFQDRCPEKALTTNRSSLNINPTRNVRLKKMKIESSDNGSMTVAIFKGEKNLGSYRFNVNPGIKTVNLDSDGTSLVLFSNENYRLEISAEKDIIKYFDDCEFLARNAGLGVSYNQKNAMFDLNYCYE